MAVILHLYEGTLELSIGILIAMEALATVEREMIDARNIHVVGTAKQFIILLECLDNLLEHFIPIHLMTQNLSQGYRIRRIAVEFHLIDVDSDTEDAALDTLGVDGSLYQRTTDFLIVPIHIVRPFQCDAVGIGIQCILHGKGSGL